MLTKLIATTIALMLKHKVVVGTFQQIEAEFEIPQDNGGVIKVVVKADNLDVKAFQKLIEETKI